MSQAVWILEASNSPDVRVFATKDLAIKGMAICCRRWLWQINCRKTRDKIDRFIQQEDYEALMNDWPKATRGRSKFCIKEYKVIDEQIIDKPKL